MRNELDSVRTSDVCERTWEGFVSGRGKDTGGTLEGRDEKTAGHGNTMGRTRVRHERDMAGTYVEDGKDTGET